MNTDPLEILLAQLFANLSEVERFLGDREAYARDRGLTAVQIAEILKIDGASLQFAAKGFERKRRLRD
jgi:hypothetical protein